MGAGVHELSVEAAATRTTFMRASWSWQLETILRMVTRKSPGLSVSRRNPCATLRSASATLYSTWSCRGSCREGGRGVGALGQGVGDGPDDPAAAVGAALQSSHRQSRAGQDILERR